MSGDSGSGPDGVLLNIITSFPCLLIVAFAALSNPVLNQAPDQKTNMAY